MEQTHTLPHRDQYGVTFCTHTRTHRTNDIHQLGANEDVQIRRGPGGYLVLPKNLKIGSKKITDFIVESKCS